MSHYLVPPTHPPHGQRAATRMPPEPPCQDRLTCRERERSSYLKMLTNIANDLDVLLTDLCHMHPCNHEDGDQGQELGNHTLNSLTQHSGDTIGKDSFLSSAEAASRHLGDNTGSSQSLLSSSSDNLSVDSGHDERTQGTSSPLVFDPNHFGSKLQNIDSVATATMTPPLPPNMGFHDNESQSGTDLRPISLVERLAKTHSIWLLTEMSRAGAVHLLKDRDTGVFIIRKSSQTMSLALSVQNRLTDRANVDHYLIEASDYGMRLQGSAHFFHSVPSLIAHYIENLDELPYCLTLPVAIAQAKSSRELASLAMLGQDFWLSPVSRKTRSPSPPCSSLHKSCSEPIDIRQPLQQAVAPPYLPNSPPLSSFPAHSLSDFSDFVTAHQVQQEENKLFNTQIINSQCSAQNPQPACVSPPRELNSDAHIKFGPHVLRLKILNNSPFPKGVEEMGNASIPNMQLVEGSPPVCGMSDAYSQTDFSSMNRHKSNLYSMTPVNIILPENAYFRSSLSDKMSDYEDIWRSSCYDSDSVRNSSIKGGGCYDVGTSVTAKSDFTKFFAISGNQENNVQKPISVIVSSAHKDPLVTQAHQSVSAKCEKTKVDTKLLHPLGRLSRLKSSSDSSLATIASPVYAEPADAVVFREKQNQLSGSSARRRSAPSVSVLSVVPESRKSAKQAALDAVQPAKLATIHSGDGVDQPENTCFEKLVCHTKKIEDPKQRSGGGITRSQSMRTSHETARLMKKTGWQERFNRLKLGTKVLSHCESPYAASVPNIQPQIDDCLFVADENSTNPSLNRFPVHQLRMSHAINRGSYFSESSTVQDIISCAMPELMVRPIQAQHLVIQADKPLSEYDNFSPYAPPSGSSHGTIFCKPWEGSVVDTLLQSSTKHHLPPAMDLQERVQKWQEANQTFHQHQHQQPCPQRPSRQPQKAQQHLLKQAHTVQTAAAAVGGSAGKAGTNVNLNKSGKESVHGGLTPQQCLPHQSHFHKPTSPANPRPVSMYHQQQNPTKHPLNRSLSNPNEPQPNHLSHPAQLLHQQHFHHRHQHGHHQKQGRQTALEPSPVAVDCRKSGLSSNCPDVINCHHVANAGPTLSDDEVLVQPKEATFSHRGHHEPNQKQMGQTPGSKIRQYIYRLSQDHSTTFGSTIENFIQCTVDSQVKTPHHVMRNVRQFMTGIKNYLVKHGEGQLEDLIERERSKLGTNEILNIDALIETTLHMCVLKPLKHHIYRLFVDFHGRNNSLELMSNNIKYARTKTALEIGIKPGVIPPQSTDMETIKHYLDKMQRAYSPLKKLENLLNATSAIYDCVKFQGKQQVSSRGPASLGADDFLPLLIYVLVHCGLVSAEIEADYMWGLLHPSVLTGEGGYYLTTLSSAVLILKNFQEAHENKTASLEGHLPTLAEVQGFLKIAFPDELRDTILWKTLPVRPNMNTKDVCAMIAHKFKITNPQDYGLILLSNGEESQLADNQCPQILKKDNLAAGKESFFAYRRLGANIAWPSSMKHS